MWSDLVSGYQARLVIMRWLGILFVSVFLTSAALVLADPKVRAEFKDEDHADYFVEMSVKISIDFDRKIAVSEKDTGDIVFLRDSNSTVLKEVKGYCVRANYQGNVWLRIKDTKGLNYFSLDNENNDSITIAVRLTDKLTGRTEQSVKPNSPIQITAAGVDYKCVSQDATTELEVSGEFDPDTYSSGHYQTILSLVFSAG